MVLALASATSSARAQTVIYQAPPPAQPAPPTAPVATSPGPWRPGDPVPPGYHVEEKPRSELVTAGYIVAGIPYLFSAIAALSADQKNESGWLYVPFAGPWMTLGRRSYSCNPDAQNQSTSQSLGCVADVFVIMGLITDGILQATGGTLLFIGYVATKPGLARNDEGVRILPMRVGTGMGAGVVGTLF